MHIHVERKISEPSADLWAYLADFGNIQAFHPFLKGSHLTEGTQSCEVGGTRQCDMKDGNFLKERIVEWEEGSHYTVEIYETSLPVKKARATLGVRPMDDHASVAYMTMDFTPKSWLMSPFLYLMTRYQTVPGILRGLEKLHERAQQAV